MRTFLGLVAVITSMTITDVSRAEDDICYLDDKRTNVTVKDETLRLLLVGDIGGLPWAPFYTEAQKEVAAAMKVWARKIGGFHGVINVGDNIYFTGVNTETDERFNSTFEEVYSGREFDVTWYTIAGNHDNFGTVEAQVNYTKRSRKWFFPDLYYKSSFTFGEKKTTVDVVFIDTVVLCGNTADFEEGTFIDILIHPQHEPMYPKDGRAAVEHWRWIDQTLASSTANYLFVAGHYPVYSVASHGPSDCLLEKLVPRLKKYNVSAYFAGHEHSIQHFKTKNEENGHEIHHVLSGAISRTDYSGKYLTDERIPLNSFQFRPPLRYIQQRNPITHIDPEAIDVRNFTWRSIRRYERQDLKSASSNPISYPHTLLWWPLSQLGMDTVGGFVQMNVTSEVANLKVITGNDEEIYNLTIYPRNLPESTLSLYKIRESARQRCRQGLRSYIRTGYQKALNFRVSESPKKVVKIKYFNSSIVF